MRPAIFILSLFVLIYDGSCGRITGSSSAGNNVILKSSASHFLIEKTDSCTNLIITDPWQGAEGVRQLFYLVNDSQSDAFKSPGACVIRVPVRRLICLSTTHLAMISALGKADAVAGFSGAGFIFDSTLAEKAKNGSFLDVGSEAGLNNEQVIKCNPDLIMMYGIGSESAGSFSGIRDLGYQIMFNADYLETDPLGKAEWIRVFGALLCEEKKADSIFASIERSYDSLKKYIDENINYRPEVMIGMPFRDTWFISPGNSYISNLIMDAGGNYIWRDTHSSYSMPFSLESVYHKSLKADFWINTGAAESKKEIAALDPRFASLPCYIKGNLYNNNKRMSPGGGNDYWESGAVNPHLILKDIASILHPGIFGNYNLYYYRKIE